MNEQLSHRPGTLHLVTDLRDYEQPDVPSGTRWQNYTLTLGGPDSRPFEDFNDRQRGYFEGLGAKGWALVGVTTLANGWLMIAFRRPWPSNPDGAEPAHHGVYV